MKIFLIAALLIAGLLPVQAHAYMDPGTGSLFLQMILGGVAGVFVGARIYWKKIKSFFKGGEKADTQ